MIQLEFPEANEILLILELSKEKHWTIRLDCRDGNKITCRGNCSVSYDIAGEQLWVSADGLLYHTSLIQCREIRGTKLKIEQIDHLKIGNTKRGMENDGDTLLNTFQEKHTENTANIQWSTLYLLKQDIYSKA